MHQRTITSVLLAGTVCLLGVLTALVLARGDAHEPAAVAPHPAPAGDAGPEVETAVFAVG